MQLSKLFLQSLEPVPISLSFTFSFNYSIMYPMLLSWR